MLVSPDSYELWEARALQHPVLLVLERHSATEQSMTPSPQCFSEAVIQPRATAHLKKSPLCLEDDGSQGIQAIVVGLMVAALGVTELVGRRFVAVVEPFFEANDCPLSICEGLVLDRKSVV
jgi:hypothetical protein